MKRRSLLIGLGSVPLLGGCGFHPLLAPSSQAGSAPAGLRAIYVPVMAERTGQLFREALQARLNGSGVSVVPKYEFTGSLAVSEEGIGVERDNSTTRFRKTATCTWTLSDLTPKRAVVATGFARLLDGFDSINSQYISNDFVSEDATRRLASNMADRVVQQLATWFDQHPAAA